MAIKTDSLYALGTYLINIPYVSTTNGALTFNLVRSPAVLETPSAVNIDPINADPVELHEVGLKSGIRDLNFHYSLSGFNQNGLFNWADGFSSLKLGERKPFVYCLDPDIQEKLPLGIHKGTLFIDSKVFTTPISVSLTVTSRLPKIWIIVMVLAGLIVGFIVKTILAAQTANEATRVTGYQLIADIVSFSDGIGDNTVKTTLGLLIQRVKEIIDGADFIISASPSTAMSDLQTLRSNFNAAKQNFLDLRITTNGTVNNLNKALNNRNTVSTVTMYLKEAIAILPDANKDLADYDVTSAQGIINSINDESAAGLSNYVIYFSSVVSYLTAQVNYPEKATNTFAVFSTEATSLQSALTQILYDPSNPSVSVSKANSIQKVILTIPAQLLSNILDDFKGNKGFDAPESFVETLQKWIDVINGMIINVQGLQNASGYPAKSELDAINMEWGAAQEETEIRATNFIADFKSDLLNERLKITKKPDDTGIPNPLILKDRKFSQIQIKKLLDQAKKRFLYLNVLQSGVLMILIGAGAYSSLQANFIGFPSEFISIFLLAFSLDITVATVGQFKAKLS